MSRIFVFCATQPSTNHNLSIYPMSDNKQSPQITKVKVKITNENNGKHATFEETDDTLVSVVIEKMYKSPELGIGRARLPADRLRCNEGGADIFRFADLTLKRLGDEHCKSLHWLFAGEAGGA
jgi:hypothetical protein